MEITYTITEQDYLQFNLFHMKNSQTAMNALKVQRFLIPIVYMVVAYFFAKLMGDSYILSFVIFGIAAVLWIVYYPKYFYNSVIRRVRKMIQEGKNEGILGEHLMILTEEGIVDKNSTGETRVNWSGIQDLKEDDQYLYLYNSSVSAYILPKREIENVEGLKAYIHSHK